MPGDVDPIILVLLVLALLLSAFFSSSETAFMSLQRVRLRHLERTGVRGAAKVRRLTDQADRTLVTILIGNNLVNTAAAALGTVIAAQLLGAGAAVVVATVGVTALLLVFGEITPKTIALRHSERLALLYSSVLDLLSRAFLPLVFLLSKMSAAIATLVGGGDMRSLLSQEEIRTVILMGEEAGVLHREETRILRNVLQLENTPVRQVMVPRTEIVGVEATLPVAEVARITAEKGFTRMPVYEGDLDHIVGMVHSKDILVRFLAGDEQSAVRSIMRNVPFVPATKPVSSLLYDMRDQATQMAVLVDEYGGTAGIVTLEDLLEEVVGEITSEYGAERRLIQSLSKNEAVVDASIAIDDLNEAFKLNLPSEEVDTLGGFISMQLGRMPRADDRFRYGDLEFTVQSVRGRRAGLVRISKVG